MAGRHLGPAAPSPVELDAAARFRTELRRFLHATEAVTAAAGLTPERYDLLLMIEAASARGEPATVSSLREVLDLSQQAVTELVKRAAGAGLVRRERSAADRRVVHLALTPEGEMRLLQAFAALRADRSTLARTLARLQRRFGAAARVLPPAGDSG